MNKPLCMLTSALVFVCFANGLSAEEINKWVDENGTVHFSDQAPKDKNVEVEKLKNKQAPKQGLSSEELSEQKRRTHKYKNEIRAKQRQAAKQSQASKASRNQQASSQSNNQNLSREDALKVCRNAYPNNTKLRSECFRKVNQQFTQ